MELTNKDLRVVQQKPYRFLRKLGRGNLMDVRSRTRKLKGVSIKQGHPFEAA
jgi:hypothetical protein